MFPARGASYLSQQSVKIKGIGFLIFKFFFDIFLRNLYCNNVYYETTSLLSKIL